MKILDHIRSIDHKRVYICAKNNFSKTTNYLGVTLLDYTDGFEHVEELIGMVIELWRNNDIEFKTFTTDNKMLIGKDGMGANAGETVEMLIKYVIHNG